MKILLNTYSGYGNWFSRRLLNDGHDVTIYCSKPEFNEICLGLVPYPINKEPNYGNFDLSLFDLTGKPRQAERSLRDCPTIGDGNLHCLLEDDRQFGIELMEQCKIDVPEWQAFSNLDDAKEFIKETKKRYVFKPDGGQDQDAATTYVSESAEDLLEYLDKVSQDAKGQSFILQEVVEGVEISTEGYFNGEDFYFVNGTLEEKKFMNEGKGPNTGCSGNLVWWYERDPRIFREGLGKTKEALRRMGFRGMIDLNSIVTESKLYGLEWTPRWGYDASATLFQLVSNDLGEFLFDVAYGNNPNIEFNHKFGAAIRLSIPPYPSEIEGHHPEDVPVKIKHTKDLDEFIDHCYMYDVKRIDKDELVTVGKSGMIAVPLGRGGTIRDSFEMVDQKINMIKIPNMQYRTDIEAKCLERYNKLEAMGWFR